MKYIFYFTFILSISCNISLADTIQLTNLTQGPKYTQNDYIEQLNYAEQQFFNENTSDEFILSKLEKLEMFLFGAIQAGNLGYRIGNIYNQSKAYHNRRYAINYPNRRIPAHNYKYYSYPTPSITTPPHRYPYYTALPVQTLPKKYTLGTTVRIID